MSTRIGKKRVAPSLVRKKMRKKSLQTSRSLVYPMTFSSLARNWMLVGKALFFGVKLRAFHRPAQKWHISNDSWFLLKKIAEVYTSEYPTWVCGEGLIPRGVRWVPGVSQCPMTFHSSAGDLHQLRGKVWASTCLLAKGDSNNARTPPSAHCNWTSNHHSGTKFSFFSSKFRFLKFPLISIFPQVFASTWLLTHCDESGIILLEKGVFQCMIEYDWLQRSFSVKACYQWSQSCDAMGMVELC